MAFFKICQSCSTFVETELLPFVGTEITCVLTYCVDEIYSDKSSSEAPYTNSLFFLAFLAFQPFL